jgi:hypothetical protein
MKIVTCFGGVYRLSDAQYRKMLNDTIADGGFELPGSRYLGDIVENVTDLTPGRAREMLDELVAERRARRKDAAANLLTS